MTSSQVQPRNKNGSGQRQIRSQLDVNIRKTFDSNNARAFRTTPVLARFRGCWETSYKPSNVVIRTCIQYSSCVLLLGH